MKPSIKKLWITTLLSGKYKQGRGNLKKGEKFCCLGVLSDLYAKKHNVKWEDDEDFPRLRGKTLLGESGVLPSKVMKWAGLFRKNPSVKLTKEAIKKTRGDIHHKEDLASMNDEGCNFKIIAECIEKSL